jgi:hypothetical protein
MMMRHKLSLQASTEKIWVAALSRSTKRDREKIAAVAVAAIAVVAAAATAVVVAAAATAVVVVVAAATAVVVVATDATRGH